MSKRLYRVTRDPAFLKGALGKTEHLFVKAADGAIICEKHQQLASLCRRRQDGKIVYENTLDGEKYRLVVERVMPYVGKLTLTRAGVVIVERQVGIMYDAPFGPDGEDVYEWEHIGIQAADEDYRRRGERPPNA